MVRKFETIHYGIQISLSKQWWHCSQFDISQRKLVRRLIKAAVQELDLVILNWVSQNEFKVCSYVLTHMHRQTDTQTTHTHTQALQHVSHLVLGHNIVFLKAEFLSPCWIWVRPLCSGGQICWIWTSPLSLLHSTAHAEDSLMGQGRLELGSA